MKTQKIVFWILYLIAYAMISFEMRIDFYTMFMGFALIFGIIGAMIQFILFDCPKHKRICEYCGQSHSSEGWYCPHCGGC